MDKFFNSLSKPSKWIFVIGGFFYATWFAITQAVSIDGQFVSVIVRLVIMAIGTALLVGAPLLVLLGKNEAAKMVFLFLIGYWVLNTARNWLSNAEAFTDSRDGLAIAAGIFAFLAGLGLAAIIVLVILEFLFKAKFLRFVSFLVMLGVIVLAFIGGLLFAIYEGTVNRFWPLGADYIVDWMILPIVICFGYLYFFGAPAKK